MNFLPIFGALRFLPLKIKKILFIFGIDVERKFSCLFRAGLDTVDKILSISENTKKLFLSINKFSTTKISIIPCTLDTLCKENINLKSKQELFLPDGNMILTVSRLDPSENYKNIDLVIESLPEVLQKIPNTYLVIVGDGADLGRLKEIARNMNLINKVIFVGRASSESLPSYYKACDVFVLPSTKEGFGIVFLEAMYFSKPCIGARAGAIPEVVEDCKTGLLINPDNKAELSKAIISLLDDKSLSKTMGNAGKEVLENKFSFGIFKQKLELNLCQ